MINSSNNHVRSQTISLGAIHNLWLPCTLSCSKNLQPCFPSRFLPASSATENVRHSPPTIPNTAHPMFSFRPSSPSIRARKPPRSAVVSLSSHATFSMHAQPRSPGDANHTAYFQARVNCEEKKRRSGESIAGLLLYASPLLYLSS
jgi:hypothetical protein